MSTLDDLLAEVMTAVGLPLLVGANAGFENENANPPRVVWIPVDEEFSSPVQRQTTVHTVADAELGFEVVVWGENYNDAREIRRKLLVALADQYSGDATVLVKGAQWLDERVGGWVKNGNALGLRVTIPDTIDTDPRATATTVLDEVLEATDTAAGDGVLGNTTP